LVRLANYCFLSVPSEPPDVLAGERQQMAFHVDRVCRRRGIRRAFVHRSAERKCRLTADSAEKALFGRRPKFFWTADALHARQREGPHKFNRTQPRTVLLVLKSRAAAERPNNRPSRDFRSRSIFDFFNSITPYGGHSPTDDDVRQVRHNPTFPKRRL
jgi:hypothetical protein